VHAGLLTGWQTAEVFLAQDRAPLGSRVEQIAPDFYRIRQVPDGGSIRLGSTVQARESRATAAAGYLGATRPSGNLALTNQTGLAALLALEQELDDSWSAELTVGRQHLAGRGTGTSLDVTSLGAGVKWYVMQGQTRPFISLSLERQSVDHGPSGWARVAGCGLQHRINNRFDAELRAMHTVGTPFAPDLRTTRLLAGLRHAF
jgi:hypothetical protein